MFSLLSHLFDSFLQSLVHIFVYLFINCLILFEKGDLLTRTDKTQGDAKLHEQKRRKEQVGNELADQEEKLNNKKIQGFETRVTVDSKIPNKINPIPSDSIEFSTPASTTEVISQTKPVNPRQNGAFLPPEPAQGFPDSTNKMKPKPIGVIGGQLASSLCKSSSSQSSPRSSDESAKILTGPIQPPTSSLSQASLHHITTPGSQITSSSLHQPVFPSFGSDSQALSNQSSRIHQILKQQPMTQIRPSDASHKLPSSLFPQPPILSTVPGSAGTVPKESAFIPSALAPNPNPAPQQSKLLKWTQSISMDTKGTTSSSVGQADRDSTRTGTSTASDTVSTSVTPIGAPVTVDPVSAKWGVIAAPRLSPTPSEFKPGVQWKPKAELERGDKRSSLADDAKESADEEEPKGTQDSSVNGPISDRLPPAGIIRPPPGLSTASTFEPYTKTVDPQVVMLDSTMEQGATKQPSRQWLSLSGLKQTVSSLEIVNRVFNCQGLILKKFL